MRIANPDSNKAVTRRLRLAKIDWRQQIMEDHNLTPATKVVAWFYSDRMTMKRTKGWYRNPLYEGDIKVYGSQKKLAEEAGVHKSTVSDALNALVEHRHLELTSRGHSGGVTNRYKFLFKAGAAK